MTTKIFTANIFIHFLYVCARSDATFVVFMQFISNISINKGGSLYTKHLSLCDASHRKHRRQQEKWKCDGVFWWIAPCFVRFVLIYENPHTWCWAQVLINGPPSSRASCISASICALAYFNAPRMHQSRRQFTTHIYTMQLHQVPSAFAAAALHLPPFNFILISGQMKM